MLHAVIWWASLVLVTLDAARNDSAVPDDTTPASEMHWSIQCHQVGFLVMAVHPFLFEVPLT